MITKLRKPESDCYAAMEECEIISSEDEAFLKEFREFRTRTMKILKDYGSCEIGGVSSDFSFTPDDEDYDLSRMLSIVTSEGRKLNSESLDRLSTLLRDQTPEYRIFIDGEDSRRKPFVIILFPNGEMWGYEEKGVNLLTSLGFKN